MRRYLLALFIGGVVVVAGTRAFVALDIGGLAWYGLLIFAGVVASLFDRAHFYGIEPEPKR